MPSSHTRRTFLRGAAGASLALPWLESLATAAPAHRGAQRLAFFYLPDGVVRRGFFPGEADAAVPQFSNGKTAVNVNDGVAVGLHTLTSLTPTQSPLEPFVRKITFVSGMDRFYKNGSDVHAQCGSCFLSQATAHSVKDSIYPLARTLDHVVGDVVGGTTPLRTLELSCNSHTDNKESMYFDNISWYSAGQPAPSLRDPRKVYARLFGTGGAKEARSITDLVLDDARDMQKRLGKSDRDKFAEYFESIRSIEEQIDRREKLKVDLSKVKLDLPVDSHLPRGDYIRLMGEMMVAALQAGITNVATLMVGAERWDTPFTYEGLFDKPMSHHQMSHDQHQFTKELLALDRFHMEIYAHLIARMDAIKEADGRSLLDNTLFVYGAGLGDGATHQYTRLPIIVAGSGGGRFRTGRHLHCPDGTALANLWLTIAGTMGVKADRFADSTGPIDALLA